MDENQSHLQILLTHPALVLSVGDALGDLLGFIADDFIQGKVCLKSRIHADDQDIADDLFSLSPNTASGTHNVRIRHANGRIKCIKLRYSRATEKSKDSSNRIVLNLHLFEAKALWQQTPPAISQQSIATNFIAMMESTDDFIYFKDRNHVFTGASQTLVAITDPSEHWTDLLGQVDYDVFPEEYADVYYKLEKQVFAGIHVAHEVQKMVDNHGNHGWVDNRKYPIKNDAGEITGLFGIARIITEQKLAEQALIESERFLKQSQLMAGLGTFVLDVATMRWRSSDLLDKILGIDDRYERTKESWAALIHPEDRAKAKNYMTREVFIAKNKTIDREYRIVRQVDQAECWIRAIGKLAFDDQGQPWKIHGTVQDVTASHQDRLNEQRAILGNSLVGLVTVKNRVIVWCNSAFEIMLGYMSGELIGTPMRHFYVSDADYRAVGESYDLVKKEGVAYTKHECIRKDGRHIWVDMSVAILHQDTKEFLWTFVDVTEHVLLQKELSIAATAFESQEGIIVADHNSIILKVNSAFTAITGYSAEEVIGNTPRLLSSGLHDADFYRTMWRSVNTLGAWEGEIWNKRKNGEIFPEHLVITAVQDSRGVVTNYVATMSDITLQKQASEEIKQLAFYDPLTNLPNRRLLLDRLNHALVSCSRTGKRGAILFLDLDNFKNLNDTLGHDVGDLLLKQVAERLLNCVREGDTVARLGGDEYVVMLEDLSEHVTEAATQVEVIGNKIIAALNTSYQLGGNEYLSTSSVGVAVFGEAGQTQETILKQADIAMYQAKKAGRNALRYFDPKMQEAISMRASLEAELRKALARKQFQLHYQIQVDKENQTLGAEVLIRWQHPERGMVSPFHFIPLAEETGLIVPIGQWVLETACAQIKQWQNNALTQHLTLSVNVSAKQFHQIDFVAQVKEVIQRYAINPMLLKLELTESMLLDQIEATIATMNALKEMHIRFSLDDFGTGYSSLQYLKKLPLYQLKIDQSFVRDIVEDSSDKAIVRTIIAMAQSLELNVIAEGVETEQQRQLLLENGCEHFQGYLFSKPVTVEQFELLLNKS